MITYLKIFSVMFVSLFISGCLTTPLETVRIEPTHLTKQWHVSNAADFGKGKGSIVERVPIGQNKDNWQELISIQFLESAKETPKELVKKLESIMRARCDSTYWGIISQEKESVLYEWRVDNCPALPDQHEVARILKGNDGLHRVAYVSKNKVMPATDRKNWIETLSRAFVKKNGQKISLDVNN